MGFTDILQVIRNNVISKLFFFLLVKMHVDYKKFFIHDRAHKKNQIRIQRNSDPDPHPCVAVCVCKRLSMTVAMFYAVKTSIN